MKLAIFNGSPRNKKSNSKILAECFLEGYSGQKQENVNIYYLASLAKMEENVRIFEDSDEVIIFFPLYTDSMPGIVKEFLERIAENPQSQNKRVGFVVQSGFPESIHSTYVKRYLKKYCARIKVDYIGTVIKGGVEGIQIMPPSMTRKLFNSFKKLGENFAKSGNFSKEIVEELGMPFKLSKTKLFIYTVGKKIGLTDFYWNSNLKKNNAYEKRYAQPYLSQR